MGDSRLVVAQLAMHNQIRSIEQLKSDSSNCIQKSQDLMSASTGIIQKSQQLKSAAKELLQYSQRLKFASNEYCQSQQLKKFDLEKCWRALEPLHSDLEQSSWITTQSPSELDQRLQMIEQAQSDVAQRLQKFQQLHSKIDECLEKMSCWMEQQLAVSNNDTPMQPADQTARNIVLENFSQLIKEFETGRWSDEQGTASDPLKRIAGNKNFLHKNDFSSNLAINLEGNVESLLQVGL